VIRLTEGQEKALTILQDWLLTDETEARLIGAAGTGKTTVLKTFIRELSVPLKRQTIITAPTHKAKKIASKITGLDGSTIQAILGLRPATDLLSFSLSKPEFDFRAKAKINDCKICIVDECSMVNKGLYTLLVEKAKEVGAKLLFVGDSYQLPPIKESSSLTLTNHMTQAVLTEVVRQAETNKLSFLLKIIRKDIDNGTDKFLKFMYDNASGEGCYDVDKKEGFRVIQNKQDFADELIKIFKSPLYKEDKDFVKFASWTNPNVMSWADYIRTNLGFNINNIVNVGEVLTAYRSVAIDDELVLANSEDYVIHNIGEYETSPTNTKISGRWIQLRSTDSSDTANIFVVDSIDENIQRNFVEIAYNHILRTKDLSGLNRKEAWKSYFTFVNNNISLISLKHGKDEIIKKTLYFGYASTVHKTQGSTYEHIVVNGSDILRNPNKKEQLQLWYVALSRARSSALIYLN